MSSIGYSYAPVDHAQKVTASVFLVVDEGRAREHMCRFLEGRHLAVEAYATPEEFLEQFREKICGCLLLDLQAPGLTELDVQQRLCVVNDHLPEAVQAAPADATMAVASIGQGPVEVLAQTEEGKLLDGIERALAQAQLWQHREAELVDARRRLASLTPREQEVLKGVLAGRVSRQIAEELSISRKTVEMHRARIMQKMRADSLATLIRTCVRLEDRLGPSLGVCR